MEIESKYNENRANAGLPPIQIVWCRICRTVNKHFWWNCPNIRCKICNAAHPTFTCKLYYACQWCGSTEHISQMCNNPSGEILKGSTRRRCYRCGRFGHIASSCSNPVRRRRFRRRFRRSRRRRRR